MAIQASKPRLETWILESIEQYVNPFYSDLVTSNLVSQCLPANLRGENDAEIGRVLRKIGGEDWGEGKQLTVRRRGATGHRGRPVIIRNHERWREADKASVVRELERTEHEAFQSMENT